MHKNLLLFAFGLCLLFCFTSQTAHAQFGAWNYLQSVTAVNQTGMAQADYQIRLIVDTQTLIGQGKLESDGRDLRFGSPCGSVVYDYWIEDFLNTDTTVVWVRLDSIDMGATLNFGMYYGNPSATAMSSFSATFPNAIVTTGTVNLMPGVNYGWIEVGPGGTLNLSTGVVNDVHVRYADIQGTISGNARGYQSPSGSSPGTGPGGGAWGTSSGAGGGSYGGLGGVGGYDANDPINQPGPVYGTTTGPDIDMGSTGGCASGLMAGHGGGAIRLTAEWLQVGGMIDCNGGLAQQPGGGQGSGGGSGGGILLHGDHVSFTGAMTAQGNGGSIGTSTANDDGGGGGGGRIKIFYESSLVNTGTTNVNGGPGGVNGGAGQGAPGAAGTVHSDTMSFHIVDASLGSEQPNSMAAPIVTSPAVGCMGDSVLVQVTGGFTTYTFVLNGTQAQSSSDSSFTFLLDSTSSLVVTTTGVCTYVDSLLVSAAPAPDPGLVVFPGPYCDGDSVPLGVTPGFSSVLWSNSSTASSILVTTSGTYSVMVTDTNGCVGHDTAVVNFLPAPNPVITQNGSMLSTGTYTSYQWLLNGNPITSATNQSYTATATGSYTVSVTDSNGCTGTSTVPVMYVGIEDGLLDGVSAYPNPFTGTLQLVANFSAAGEVRLEVFDLTGRRWLETGFQAAAGEWRQDLDLRTLPAGLYFLALQSETGRAVLRVVKR